jgi:hypothetical protein
MKYEVTIRGTLVIDSDDNQRDRDEMLEEAFDFTMREMLKLADLRDPSATGSVTSGEIVLAAVIAADDYGNAVSIADAAMRSALHAAGIGTRTWETTPPHIRIECTRVEAEELVDA